MPSFRGIVALEEDGGSPRPILLGGKMPRWTIYDPISKFLLSSLTVVGVGSGISVLSMFLMLWNRPVDQTTPEILAFIIEFALIMVMVWGAFFGLLVLLFCIASAWHLLPFRRTLCRRIQLEILALPSVRAIRAIAR